VVVVVSLAVGCSEGGGDAAASHHHHPTAPIAGVTAADRCDLGFNTATFNETTAPVHEAHGPRGGEETGSQVDFTLEDWAGVFADEQLGLTTPQVVDAVRENDIYRRHILAGVLTHKLGPDAWTPMTDPAECAALAGELRQARAAAVRHPTVADALADGYKLGDFYNAGLGVHYQNWDLLSGDFEPGRPVQLLYDGTTDDSTLVGLSYVVLVPGDAPPDGFTGSNDVWHHHRSWCLDAAHGGVNLAADVLSVEECTALGGSYVVNTNAWMLHMWVVPGCENDWGIFAAANPRLPYLPDGVAFESGCNSGKTIGDPLALDGRGGELVLP
jgi:hypothetical protein